MKYFIFCIVLGTVLNAQSFNSDILKEFDKVRLNSNEGKVNLEITSVKKTKVKKKTYAVYRKKGNSLVTFLHKNEKGTVILNIKNNLYIKVPSSKKAIRITPIQRLFGDASIGDILELEFDEYYKVIKQEKNTITLKAKKKESTYHKIILFIKEKKLNYAKLFSYSGKLLKTVHYTYNKSGKIDRYKFVSDLSHSTVYIKSVKDMKLPNRLFKKSNIKKAYKNASVL